MVANIEFLSPILKFRMSKWFGEEMQPVGL